MPLTMVSSGSVTSFDGVLGPAARRRARWMSTIGTRDLRLLLARQRDQRHQPERERREQEQRRQRRGDEGARQRARDAEARRQRSWRDHHVAGREAGQDLDECCAVALAARPGRRRAATSAPAFRDSDEVDAGAGRRPRSPGRGAPRARRPAPRTRMRASTKSVSRSFDLDVGDDAAVLDLRIDLDRAVPVDSAAARRRCGSRRLPSAAGHGVPGWRAAGRSRRRRWWRPARRPAPPRRASPARSARGRRPAPAPRPRHCCWTTTCALAPRRRPIWLRATSTVGAQLVEPLRGADALARPASSPRVSSVSAVVELRLERARSARRARRSGTRSCRHAPWRCFWPAVTMSPSADLEIDDDAADAGPRRHGVTRLDAAVDRLPLGDRSSARASASRPWLAGTRRQ